MTQHAAPLRGIVRGNTIELDEAIGLRDGQEVRVSVQAVGGAERQLLRGEGIRRSAGAWAEDSEKLDRYLEWNRRQRHRHTILPS